MLQKYVLTMVQFVGQLFGFSAAGSKMLENPTPK